MSDATEMRSRERVWSVWRQDDNGNQFLVRSGLDRDAAEKLVAELESHRHKQHYWIEKVGSDEHPVANR